MYRCPATKMHTHAWIADPVEQAGNRETEFVSVECVACRRIHLINPNTGTIVGVDED